MNAGSIKPIAINTISIIPSTIIPRGIVTIDIIAHRIIQATIESHTAFVKLCAGGTMDTASVKPRCIVPAHIIAILIIPIAVNG